MHTWDESWPTGAEMEERARLANEAMQRARIEMLRRMSADAKALRQRGKMDFTYYPSVDALLESVK